MTDPIRVDCDWCGESVHEREIINGHCYLCRMGPRDRTPTPPPGPTREVTLPRAVLIEAAEIAEEAESMLRGEWPEHYKGTGAYARHHAQADSYAATARALRAAAGE